MPRYELEYPKGNVNTVKRLNNRASYALETIHTIVNAAQLIHVSFVNPSSPFPIVLPMIGKMGSFDRPSASLGDPCDLYLHGYVSSRMMNLARSSSQDDGDGDGETGMPVTVAASHVDGLVMALTPFHHSYNYRSAVLFGNATIVDDPEEKLWAMELVTDGIVPGRWKNSRVPPTSAEMQSTSILKICIISGSAKIRTGVPGDDKHDMENEDVTSRVWTGVVPTYQAFGDPITSSYNRAELPGYLQNFVREQNQRGEEAAVKAVDTQTGSKS